MNSNFAEAFSKSVDRAVSQKEQEISTLKDRITQLEAALEETLEELQSHSVDSTSDAEIEEFIIRVKRKSLAH